MIIICTTIDSDRSSFIVLCIILLLHLLNEIIIMNNILFISLKESKKFDDFVHKKNFLI